MIILLNNKRSNSYKRNKGINSDKRYKRIILHKNVEKLLARDFSFMSY